MKKQILLLLGLVLIGTLGLAAGIEASKGNWDYRSLVSRAPRQSPQATAQTILATKTVSSPAVSECAANDSAPNPFVRFVLRRESQQNAMMSQQALCVTTTAEEKNAKKISFCPSCPGEDAGVVDLQSLIAPQRPLSPSESVPNDTEAIRFIG